MEQTILCLNGGSSSLKFAVYRLSGAGEEKSFSGAVEAIGQPIGKAWLRSGDKALREEKANFQTIQRPSRKCLPRCGSKG